MVSSTLYFHVFVGYNAIQGIVNTSMLPASMDRRGGLGKDLVPNCCFLGFLSIVRQLTCAFTMVSYQFITLFYSFLIVGLLVYSNGRSQDPIEWVGFQGKFVLDAMHFSLKLTIYLPL